MPTRCCWLKALSLTLSPSHCASHCNCADCVLTVAGMAFSYESDCGSLFSGVDMSVVAGAVAVDSEQDSVVGVGSASSGQSGPGPVAPDESSVQQHQQCWFQCGLTASTDRMLNIGNQRSHRWVCLPCKCARVAPERLVRKTPELQETLKR